MEFNPCPFCGVIPRIVIMDHEGNIKDNPEEYRKNPWSGLAFGIGHSIGDSGAEHCPIATYEDEVIGIFSYDTEEEAVKAWNKNL